MMRRVLLGFALVLSGAIAGVALHTALAKGGTVFAGQRPTNLGVTEGRLAPPKRSPNCVSSQADPSDAEHYIAPFRFTGAPVEAIAALRRIVDGGARTFVVRHEGDYLYAEYKSRLMGYVDDVEFYASAKEGVIHVRSASRLGRRDYGVNRERIEAIRAQFEAAQRATIKA
jgi:uncharacterized protein (DUF1499 family)